VSEPSEHRGGFGEFAGESRAFIDRSFREKILLVGVTLPGSLDSDTDESLDELAQLVDTAGADPVDRIVQRRDAPDAATYIGKGKAAEIASLAEVVDADTVVFDDELSPAQQANLEKILGRSAIDRTTVILDIFAQNAHSTEGKHQVELAQLRYRLPRLRGSGSHLSQQAGGIGTRGPGETQLEVDRRRLVTRMHRLERDLQKVRQQRSTQSKQRRRSANHTVALVGYTNAGKSTVLNRFAGTTVLAEDRLFATLDATTRRIQLPGGEAVYLTDTVGFVRKLPHQLVEAFKSTLDVVVQADLLVHVVDASAADPVAEMRAVREVLTEIGAGDVPELVALNKTDLAAPGAVARLLAAESGSVALSAQTGEGAEGVLDAVGDRLREMSTLVEVLVPFERGDVMASVHRSGQVTSEQSSEGGMLYTVRLDDASVSRLAEFIVGQR
jgi:GTP-binding protein HflX